MKNMSWVFLTAIFILTACTAQTLSPIPLPTDTSTFIPTTTQTQTPSPTSTNTPTPTITPTLIGGFPGRFITITGEDKHKTITLWNADGKKIKDLWTFPQDALIYTGGFGDFGQVDWSPTGEYLLAQACVWEPVGKGSRVQCDLYVISPDGSKAEKLPIRVWPGTTLSPDGKTIVYSAIPTNGGFDLFMINADGSGKKQLTNTTAKEGDPAFSPDGTKLVYCQDSAIRIRDLDGSNSHLFGNGWWDEYVWSPDGERIAYSSLKGAYSDIFIANVDGTGLIKLSTDSSRFDDRNPQFSLDGKYVLYLSYGYPESSSKRDPERGWYFYVASSDGSEPPMLLGSGYPARWSTDGQWIFFHGWTAGHEQVGDGFYYAVKPDGSGIIMLTDEAFGLVEGKWQPGSIPDFESQYPSFIALTFTPAPAEQ